MSNSFIWPTDTTLSGVTVPCQNGPGSNDNEGVLQIPNSFKTEASLEDGLMSYPGHFGGGTYPSAKMPFVYLQTEPTGLVRQHVWCVCVCTRLCMLKHLRMCLWERNVVYTYLHAKMCVFIRIFLRVLQCMAMYSKRIYVYFYAFSSVWQCTRKEYTYISSRSPVYGNVLEKNIRIFLRVLQCMAMYSKRIYVYFFAFSSVWQCTRKEYTYISTRSPVYGNVLEKNIRTFLRVLQCMAMYSKRIYVYFYAFSSVWQCTRKEYTYISTRSPVYGNVLEKNIRIFLRVLQCMAMYSKRIYIYFYAFSSVWQCTRKEYTYISTRSPVYGNVFEKNIRIFLRVLQCMAIYSKRIWKLCGYVLVAKTVCVCKCLAVYVCVRCMLLCISICACMQVYMCGCMCVCVCGYLPKPSATGRNWIAQSAGAVEYTDCMSAEG